MERMKSNNLKFSFLLTFSVMLVRNFNPCCSCYSSVPTEKFRIHPTLQTGLNIIIFQLSALLFYFLLSCRVYAFKFFYLFERRALDRRQKDIYSSQTMKMLSSPVASAIVVTRRPCHSACWHQLEKQQPQDAQALPFDNAFAHNRISTMLYSAILSFG